MKRIAAWVVMMCLMVAAVPQALADGGYATGEVICKGVSLRVDHKTSAKRLATIWNGETFDILEEYDGWYRASYNGMEGWLLMDYVMEAPEHLYTRKGNIPARAWPSKQSKRVGLIDEGVRLTVIEELDKYWIVSFRDAVCYVSKDASVWTESEAKNSQVQFRIEMLLDTDLRAGTSNSWHVVRQVKQGEQFDVVGEEGDWYIVRCGDFFGYAWKPQTKIV